ncbi:hypothetical protein I3843_07G175700 [Carya illinoinensis]|nr:hypothetical protein I3843_07G175700 [Carya illinoinensis]
MKEISGRECARTVYVEKETVRFTQTSVSFQQGSPQSQPQFLFERFPRLL